ncbi:MAG: hypothetical protein ACJAYX_001865, partial [Planctomycetota bacterium]
NLIEAAVYGNPARSSPDKRGGASNLPEAEVPATLEKDRERS